MFNIQKYAKTLPAVAFALIASFSAMAAPQSFTGVLTDSMCGAKHMLPGKTNTECTRTCVKTNANYALAMEKKVYTLFGPQEELSRVAGKRVRVTASRVATLLT